MQYEPMQPPSYDVTGTPTNVGLTTKKPETPLTTPVDYRPAGWRDTIGEGAGSRRRRVRQITFAPVDQG